MSNIKQNMIGKHIHLVGMLQLLLDDPELALSLVYKL